MIFNRSDRIPSRRFDITGRLTRRGMPVDLPGALGSSPGGAGSLDELTGASSQPDAGLYAPGSPAELGYMLRETASGALEPASPDPVAQNRDEQRWRYAWSVLVGVLGSGYL